MKRILSIILALILALSVLPLTVFAADADLADEGVEADLADTGATNISVSYTFNGSGSSATLTTSWSAVSGVTYYTVELMNQSDSNGNYRRVGQSKGVNDYDELSCTFDNSYLKDYACGYKNYKIHVYCYKNSALAGEGYSAVFQNPLSMLSAPANVNFDSSTATLTWKNEWVSGKYYPIRLYYNGSLLKSFSCGASYDDSIAWHFEDDLVGYSGSFYAELRSSAPGYRDSATVRSNTISYNGFTFISGIAWNGYRLSWDQYARANKYVLYLNKYKGATGTDYNQIGTYNTSNTSYDFAEVFRTNGVGRYFVHIEARYGTQITSYKTSSGIRTYETPCTVSFASGGGKGTMASVQVEKNGLYTLPECTFTPSSSYKEFDKWDKGTEGSQITISGDTTITALWKYKTCTVNFLPNGGTGTMNSETNVDMGEYTLPNCRFSAPSGKHFVGWTINNSSSIYPAGKKVTLYDKAIAQQYNSYYVVNLRAEWEYNNLISSVNLTITEPKAGANPNFGVSKDNTDCDFYVGLGLVVPNGTGLEFIKGEGTSDLLTDIANYMAADETFRSGQKYTARVILQTTKTGTYFGKDLVIKINGKPMTLQTDVSDNRQVLVWADYTFTVGSSGGCLMGDVDGDGKVDNTDAVTLKRYVMGWAGYASKIKVMAAADLDGSGSVNNTDAVILKRCVMDWSGYKARYIVHK